MRHPKDIGDHSTLAIMLALHAHGYAVYTPFGENTRADLIVDNGARITRLQCKTGRLRNGSVIFRTASSYAHHRNPRVRQSTYHGQIDEFAVYCPELGAVYLIPIEHVDTRHCAALRVAPSKNRQAQGVRLAGAYEIARIELS